MRPTTFLKTARFASNHLGKTQLVRPSDQTMVHAAIATADDDGGMRSIFVGKAGGPLQVVLNMPLDFRLSNLNPSQMEVEDARYRSENHPDDVEENSKMTNFPQEELRLFMEHLNPIVVSKLGLEEMENRKYIGDYNSCYSAPTDKAAENRALQIKKFSLIRDILNDDSNREEALSYRSLGNFSFVKNSVNKDPSYMELLDEGDSVGIFRKYFEEKGGYLVNETFLNRTSCVTSLPVISNLNGVLSHGLSSRCENDQRIYENRVRKLPCSKRNPDEFGVMIRASENLVSRFGVSEASANIFRGMGNKWSGNEDLFGRGPGHLFTDKLGDYFRNIAVTILPEYLDQNNRRDSNVDVELYDLIKIVRDKITGFSTPKKLEENADRLFSNQKSVDSKRPYYQEKLEKLANISGWHKLIDDQNINGYKFEVIANKEQLKQVANEHDNCIENYQVLCEEGKSHFILGMSPQGEDFLIELKKFNKVFLLEELSKTASIDVEVEAHNLVRKINSGQIVVNKQVGSISGTAQVEDILNNEGVKELAGFDIRDKRQAENAFMDLQMVRILPKKFQKCTLNEFIEQTGIGDEIRKRFVASSEPSTSFVSAVFEKLFSDNSQDQNRG